MLPAEVTSHQKINLEGNHLLSHIEQQYEKFCEEFRNILFQQKGDIGHTLLITMDIETGHSSPIAQKSYTLPIKHIQ